MSKSFLFWLVFVLAVLSYFGLLFWDDAPRWRGNAMEIVQFLLIFLLGLQVYGKPIKD